MIALRPLQGKFVNKLSWRVKEGRVIPPQILALLDIEKCKKDKIIGEEKKSSQTTNREDTDK